MISARLVEDPFEPAELLARFMEARGAEDGAVVAFAGLARGLAKDGTPIHELYLEHHPRLTVESLVAIANDGAARFSVSAVDVVHRCGAITPGEAIVWVAVASVHRRAAFEAADYLMDRLKTEAVFWKRESGEHGSVWVEPTDTDYAERARWE